MYFHGVLSKRSDLVVDIDRDRLEARMLSYFDPTVTDEAMARICPMAMMDMEHFEPHSVRQKLLPRGYLPQYVVRHLYRPFDLRWLYWEPESELLARKVPEYFAQLPSRTRWIAAAHRHRKAFDPPPVTHALACLHVIERGAALIPARLLPEGQTSLLPETEGVAPGIPQANLSPQARAYLDDIGCDDVEGLFDHSIATIHADAYSGQNGQPLCDDWPRIPLPASAERLRASADIGSVVSALLDVECPVDRVTTGETRHELKPIGPISKADGSQVNPEAGDLSVTAGWGHAGQGGVTMPARGRVIERAYTDTELAAFREGVFDLDLTFDQLLACLGGTCVDVYLNDLTTWRCVPKRVWTYTIGGYQVMKKWLSYRERPLLGRDLTVDEARYVTGMVRRVAAILLSSRHSTPTTRP